MQTIEALKRKIDSVTDLESVVKTMKAMASVRIKQYEKAVLSLRAFSRTIDMAMQVVVSHPLPPLAEDRKTRDGHVGAVVFGSDQGMAGQLNDVVLNHTLKHLRQSLPPETGNMRFIAVGARMKRKLERVGHPVDAYIRVPGSVAGITSHVQDILSVIDEWERRWSPRRIWLYYSIKPEKTGFLPHAERLLPIDQQWVEELKKKEWPSRCLPMITMDTTAMFSSLIKQHLFTAIYKAFAESMASENQSRLQSMQQAEKNIQEELDDLSMEYHRRRQMAITGELLDIVSGFEALETT
ncbi:MAG: F0F1 ATP synthase subunit gamma [Desulfobacterales bacterium]